MSGASWQILNDRYELLSELGEGGSASVFKAKDVNLGRLVAIKVLHMSYMEDPTWLERFKREARVLCQLKHKHLVGIYALEISEQSQPFIVMEYLDGISLRKYLHNNYPTSTWQQRLKIILQVCDAMQFAHSNNIIHRDLKPENIFLQQLPEPNFVKVLDFGLATQASIKDTIDGKLTKPGTLLGTVGYMAPEVVSHSLDKQSDIYSLGCILYELLAENPLFEADSPLALFYKHCQDRPEPIAERSQFDLPVELNEVIEKCLAKDPKQRFQSMDELRLALEQILALHGEATMSISTKQQYAASGKKNKQGSVALWAVPAILILAIAAIAMNELSLESTLYFSNMLNLMPDNWKSAWTYSLASRLESRNKLGEAQLLLNFFAQNIRHRSWDAKLLSKQAEIAQAYARRGQPEAAERQIENVMRLAYSMNRNQASRTENISEYANILKDSMSILTSVRRIVPAELADTHVTEAQGILNMVNKPDRAADLEIARFRLFEACYGIHNGNTQTALHNITANLFQSKRYDEDLLWIAKATALFPDDKLFFASASDYKARILFDRKEYAKAGENYREAYKSRTIMAKKVLGSSFRGDPVLVHHIIRGHTDACMCYCMVHDQNAMLAELETVLPLELRLLPESTDASNIWDLHFHFREIRSALADGPGKLNNGKINKLLTTEMQAAETRLEEIATDGDIWKSLCADTSAMGQLHYSGCMAQMGNFFEYKHEWEKAIEWLEQSLTVYRRLHELAKSASVLGDISECYIGASNFDRAENCIKEEMTIARSINNSGQIDEADKHLKNLLAAKPPK